MRPLVVGDQRLVDVAEEHRGFIGRELIGIERAPPIVDRVMERVAATIYPGATVLPAMSTGASDQAQLRAKGIQSYGIGPAATESDALNYPSHGDVERLAEYSLYPFVQYVWTVVTEIAAHK